MYEVYIFPIAVKSAKKLFSKEEFSEFIALTMVLANNPFVGKPLTFNFFREKRIGGKRVFYLIYTGKCVVLIVGVSSKKDQQKKIDSIKKLFSYYKKFAESLRKK